MIAPDHARPIRARQRPVRRAVAVLVSRFPLVTETFILRELIEMERQGQPVLLVPLIRERAAVVHEEAVPWVRRAQYAPFLSAAVLFANLRAWRRQPVKVALLLGRLIAGSIQSPRTLLKTLALFPRAVHIAERVQADGISHVHAHFATHPTTAALIIHELTGIGFSITAHAHDIFVDRALLGWKLDRAAFVRVISRHNGAFLKRLYPAQTAGKLRVIRVGVDGRMYRYVVRTAPITPPRILCIAALKPYKGLPVLIDACRILQQTGFAFHCDIIGDGPQRRQLARAIAKAGLTESVRLLGAQPQDEVRRRLAEATLMVLPSVVARDGQMEGIPVALMEAMASGVPVIASKLSGIPELVVHGRTGVLLPPGDAAALADAVRQAVRDGAAAEQRSAAARAHVRQKFSLRRTVRALVRQFDDVNAPLPSEVSRLVSVLGRGGARGAVGVRRVHERTDSRVLELLLPRGGGCRATVLKIQRPRHGESRPASERGRHEYAVLKELWAERRTASAPHVPRPIELDALTGAVLMEPCRGEPLDRLLRAARASRDPRRQAALFEAIRATGHWLHEFQSAAPPPGVSVTAPYHSGAGSAARPAKAALEAVAENALAWLGDLERTRFFSTADAAQAAIRIARLAAEAAPAARLVRHHGDFWPGNVFVSEEGVEVIDFEGFRPGLPEEDVAWFLVHLELSFGYPGLRGRQNRAAAAFRESAGDLHESALTLCRTATALTLISRSLRDGRRGPKAALRRRALRALMTDASSMQVA